MASSIPQARDGYGTRAVWDATNGVLAAVSVLPGAVRTWTPPTPDAPTDVAVGRDGILYAAHAGALVLQQRVRPQAVLIHDGLALLGNQCREAPRSRTGLQARAKDRQGRIVIEGTIATLLDLSLGMDPDATGYDNIMLRSAILGVGAAEAAASIPEIEAFTERLAPDPVGLDDAERIHRIAALESMRYAAEDNGQGLRHGCCTFSLRG